jgi:predicted O-linked N-acetylglucosamine transferase (SPINDLY family)
MLPDVERDQLRQAIALYEKGSAREAAAVCEALLRRLPDDGDARQLLGLIRSAEGRFNEAISQFDQVLSLQPVNALVHHRRGLAKLAVNRVDDAIADFERTLVLRPEFIDALCSLGNAFATQQRYDEALACYEGVLVSEMRHWEALNNRGNVLTALGRHDEAIRSYEAAMTVAPAEAAAHFNCGLARFALGRNEHAIADFDHALERDPDHAEALHARGNALRNLRRHEEAAASYTAAAAKKPRLPFIEGDALHGRMQLCDWTDYEVSVERILHGVSEGQPVAVPFVLISISDDPQLQRRCAEMYVRYGRVAGEPGQSFTRRTGNSKIRLAYLSAKFHDHAGARLIADLLEIHDRRRFELIGVSFGPDARGEMRERLRRSFDDFLEVRERSDADVAAMLRARGVDIAIDLVGFTDNSRLGILAHRAASIQVNFLGCPGTTGADYVDYIIADETVIPIGQDACYAERVVRMPESYQVNDSKRRIADRTPTRREAGLPEASVVLCCFNSPFKITPDVFDVWMRVLGRFGDAVLWLLQGNLTAEANLKREASVRGIDPTRIIFAPHMPLPEHLARHRLADLFIDTYPCNAHVTASDALWAGLPMLTCSGRSFASRVAASLLKAVGLPDLITSGLAEYEMRIGDLLANRHELRALRDRLGRNLGTAPLFDTDRFRRHLEAAYVTMWETWRRGSAPQAFTVPALTS